MRKKKVFNKIDQMPWGKISTQWLLVKPVETADGCSDQPYRKHLKSTDGSSLHVYKKLERQLKSSRVV